jgi:hypothetical protein
MPNRKPPTEEKLREAARTIRATCPNGCNRLGVLPCPACIRAVCDLLRERWLIAQRPERREDKSA